MSVNSHNNTNHVSALDSVLKLILNIYKDIRYYLGVIIIDKVLRSIVQRYDKRHAKSSYQTLSNDNEVSEKQTNEHEELLKVNAELVEALKIERDRIRNLFSQINTLTEGLNETCNENEKLKRINCELRQNERNLKEQNTLLQNRCIATSETSSMVYYAQGDVSGLWLRKVSSQLSELHTYKIVTIPGNVNQGEFTPIINNNIIETIKNRNIALTSCDIIGIEPKPTSIKIVSAGKAIYENNKWKVLSKAKIQLI